jgi:hypothetical protein
MKRIAVTICLLFPLILSCKILATDRPHSAVNSPRGSLGEIPKPRSWIGFMAARHSTSVGASCPSSHYAAAADYEEVLCFERRVSYPTEDGSIAAIAADLDGDGDADVVAVANTSKSLVSALFNNGDGTFADAVPYGVGGGAQFSYCR